MLTEKNRGGFLNGNMLKCIALVAMTIDHIGFIMFPSQAAFRIVGRLAFPIFAFFVSEGCKYTKNKSRYFSTMLGLGIIFDIVSRLVAGTTDCNILISFGLAIVLVYLLQWVKEAVGRRDTRNIIVAMIVFVCAVIGVYVFAEILPNYVANYTGVDYGFAGIMVVVLASVFDAFYLRLFGFSVGLILLCWLGGLGPIQLFSLLTIMLILWYNGERGRLRLKYLFYIYYPAHISIIYGIWYLSQALS